MVAPPESREPVPLPDLAVSMSYWRAAVLVVLTLPFLGGALGLLAVAGRATSFRKFLAIGVPLGFFAVATLLSLSWVIRYRRGRGPMYVFTAKDLVVGRHLAGAPVPWADVSISSSSLLWSGPIVVQVDYRKPEFRSDTKRRSLVFFDKNRDKTVRRLIMPNIATLGASGLEDKLIQYARADGVELPDDR